MIVLQVKTDFCLTGLKQKIKKHYQIFWCNLSFLFLEQQKADLQHFPSRQFIQRRPGPPTMVSSKNHVSSPMSTQLTSINALFNSTQSQALLQGHGHITPSTTASGSKSGSVTRSPLNEMSGHSGPGNTNHLVYFIFALSNYGFLDFVKQITFVFADSLSLLGESDYYLEQDGFIEEEEIISGEDVMSDAINTNRHQLKRRRLFRAPRERQRGKKKKIQQQDSDLQFNFSHYQAI